MGDVEIWQLLVGITVRSLQWCGGLRLVVWCVEKARGWGIVVDIRGTGDGLLVEIFGG
ncbi:hypothetical protein [Bartonella queenslandensis]|uniref:hypothetical protein n=1 Tax=Bartonella queenslandensis TaxID=481138 RepID=UPI001BA6F705|nr:hypothetical protein [Bartonella queenslandensis]